MVGGSAVAGVLMDQSVPGRLRVGEIERPETRRDFAGVVVEPAADGTGKAVLTIDTVEA